jgi:hypothetical protein
MSIKTLMLSCNDKLAGKATVVEGLLKSTNRILSKEYLINKCKDVEVLLNNSDLKRLVEQKFLIELEVVINNKHVVHYAMYNWYDKNIMSIKDKYVQPHTNYNITLKF